jgi:hypothetical protein
MASKKRPLVVIFEDDENRRKSLVGEISQRVGRGFQVLAFAPVSTKSRAGAFEDRLVGELSARTYKDAILYVSDRDLSKIEGYIGLSEAAVSRAAERFGVPIALYAQGKSYTILSKDNYPGDGKIILAGTSISEHAHEAARLAQGFVDVAKGIDAAMSRKRDRVSPAALASSIMGRPEFSDRVVQYALGDQKALSEVFRAADSKDAESKKRRRRIRLMGTWIYDSILRFPGLLLNDVAAASYVNISTNTFRAAPEVRDLFKSALYSGPFSDNQNPFWWRPDIDDLLLKEKVETGRDLVKQKLGRKVAGCKCSVNPKLRAGYVCMLTHQPISEQNSEGGLSWFPPGADLARVNKKKLEELRPWLALY